MIWAILLDYFVFQDILVANTIIGALIIVASGLYAFHRKVSKKLLDRGLKYILIYINAPSLAITCCR